MDRMSVAAEVRADQLRLRRAVIASILAHALFLLVTGLTMHASVRTAQVSKGFVVDLVEIPRPSAPVVKPVEGVKRDVGSIPLPKDRETPKAKPKPREKPVSTQAPPKPAPPTDKPPLSAPVTPDDRPGAGGHLEPEVPFPFQYYTDAITRLIMSQWAPTPSVAESTKTIVHFEIARDGSVTRTKLVEPSGSATFDRGAIAAVQNVGRFPPLPQGFEWEQLGVKFHFIYRRGR